MAIFYMKTNIIGRSSGRSAVGAAAYRRSAKMQSVAHAAYQRGEKIIEKGNKITHDYRSKGGVVYSEIMLPDDAPPEFMDAQILWNTVEASEKRKDAQLAREIIVALPREFNLQEQIEIMREYVKTNFVNKGMIADFSIHNMGDANPHAHIMLTLRHVSQTGFGYKNTDWNKKEFLLSYREAWANIINGMLVRKGLDDRIDHRSYKEQGVDRLPYIHLGHEAAALEKKGIATRRGDYNREIKRRNEASKIRAALMEANYSMWHEQQKEILQGIKELQQQQHETIMQVVRELRQQEVVKPLEHTESASVSANTTAESVPNEVRTTLTTAKRMSEPQDAYVTHDEKSLVPRENRLQKPNVIEMAKHSGKLRQKRNSAYLDLKTTKSLRNVLESENFYMNLEIEEIEEQAQNVQTLLNRVPQLELERQNLHFWNWRRKKKLDNEIEQAEKDSKVALLLFGKTYHVNPDEISRPISQIKKKITVNKREIADKDGEIAKLEKKLAATQQEYDQYRLKYKIKVRRKSKKQAVSSAELTSTTDRRSVREQLQEFRRPREEKQRQREAIEKLEAIKPTKFLIIASPEQKKRSLGEVLGKFYRKVNGRVYPSIPPAKDKKI
jgi:hypothetical protein